MGLLDLFKKRLSPADDLRARLDRIAVVNNQVRAGRDPATLGLAVNVDSAGTVDGVRPTMSFEFTLSILGPGQWRVDAVIDDPVAHCRFWIDLAAFDIPDAPSVDPEKAPQVRVIVQKPPEHVRSPLARMAWLLAWRVEGGDDNPSRHDPLAISATVMGIDLCMKPHVYLYTGAKNERWVLLKCNRGAQSFFIGLNVAAGVGEVFPRRKDVESYQLAMDFLCTFT